MLRISAVDTQSCATTAVRNANLQMRIGQTLPMKDQYGALSCGLVLEVVAGELGIDRAYVRSRENILNLEFNDLNTGHFESLHAGVSFLCSRKLHFDFVQSSSVVTIQL